MPYRVTIKSHAPEGYPLLSPSVTEIIVAFEDLMLLLFHKEQEAKRLNIPLCLTCFITNTDLPANDIDPLSLLTSRQLQIALLLKEGHTYKTTGLKLFIESSTVKVHIKAIYRILGVKNRAELISKLS